MTYHSIIGEPGAGKTAFLAWCGYNHIACGYKAYTNFKLLKAPYTLLNDHNDLKKINHTHNFVGVDEFWKWADSRRSMSLENLDVSGWSLQHRKKGSKDNPGMRIHTDVFITSQDEGQYDSRVRNICNIFYEPEVLKHDVDEKPLVLKVKVVTFRHHRVFTRYMLIPTLFDFGGSVGVVDVCNAYDTYQEIESLEYDFLGDNKKLIDKYQDVKANKTQLTAVLHYKEGMLKSEASELADVILACQNGLM